VAKVVLRRGEAREAGGGLGGVLLIDGEPEGRSGKDVQVQGSVDVREGATVLRCPAKGLTSITEGLMQSVPPQRLLV
jgi:hypothetical protein